MDIEQLRTFVRVVELGSFAAAARQVAIAPSMVTRSIAALEHELALRLFQRTTRRLSLTEAGTAYYEEVRGALNAVDRAADVARATETEVGGPVRVTSSVAFGQTRLLPLLAALHETHPALRIELVLTDTTLDLVAERIDLAIRLGPDDDSSLVGVRLADVRFHIVASPDYLARHGHPADPADLAHRECLRLPLAGFRTLWSFRAAHGEARSVPVDGWLVVSTALALHRAASSGLGPAMLADWLVADDLASGRLIDLFPQHEVSATGFDSAVWLLYPSRAYVPRRVRVVMDALRQGLEGRCVPGRGRSGGA